MGSLGWCGGTRKVSRLLHTSRDWSFVSLGQWGSAWLLSGRWRIANSPQRERCWPTVQCPSLLFMGIYGHDGLACATFSASPKRKSHTDDRFPSSNYNQNFSANLPAKQETVQVWRLGYTQYARLWPFWRCRSAAWTVFVAICHSSLNLNSQVKWTAFRNHFVLIV